MVTMRRVSSEVCFMLSVRLPPLLWLASSRIPPYSSDAFRIWRKRSRNRTAGWTRGKEGCGSELHGNLILLRAVLLIIEMGVILLGGGSRVVYIKPWSSLDLCWYWLAQWFQERNQLLSQSRILIEWWRTESLTRTNTRRLKSVNQLQAMNLEYRFALYMNLWIVVTS